MAFVITTPCIDTRDQACVEVCPVDCIHFDEDADRMLYINPAECIDCGACQPACPVNAIFAEADVPGDQQAFISINALWYSDPAAARAQIAGVPASGGGGAAVSAGGATPVAEAPAATDAPATAPAAAAPSAEPAPAPAAPRIDLGQYKYGEAGVEGKCALCGQYVVKGGVKFRAKSVLCQECAERQDRIGNPYQRSAGQR